MEVLGRALLASEEPARAAAELELAVKLAPGTPEARLQSCHRVQSRLGRKTDVPPASEAEFKRRWNILGERQSMKLPIVTVLILAAAQPADALPQQQLPTIKTNVDEVLLDLIVCDKKGQADYRSEARGYYGHRQRREADTVGVFWLVRGSEAVSATGAATLARPRLRPDPAGHAGIRAVDGVDQRGSWRGRLRST